MEVMGSLVGFLFIWAIFAGGAGLAFAYVEGRVNKAPMRWKSAVALSICLGVIGWIILAMRSGMKYAGGMRADQKATADYARQQMSGSRPAPEFYDRMGQQAPGWLGGSRPAQRSPGYPADDPGLYMPPRQAEPLYPDGPPQA